MVIAGEASVLQAVMPHMDGFRGWGVGSDLAWGIADKEFGSIPQILDISSARITILAILTRRDNGSIDEISRHS